MKTYNELNFVEKEVLKEDILKLRNEGKSYRSIAEKISSYVKITHTTVSSICKENESAESEGFNNLDLEGKPAFCSDFLESLDNGLRNEKALFNMVYTLCNENIKEHIETGARIKTSYLKYLKDLHSIIK